MSWAHSVVGARTYGTSCLAALLAVGCGDTGPGSRPPVVAGQTVALTGRVEPAIRAGVRGRIEVQAWRMKDDGSLTPISGGEAWLDADGRYTIENLGNLTPWSASPQGVMRILIRAFAADEVRMIGQAVVERRLHGPWSPTVAPVGLTSTAAAAVLLAATASRDWSGNYTFAEARALVGDNLLAGLAGGLLDANGLARTGGADVPIAALLGWRMASAAQGTSAQAFEEALQIVLDAEQTLDARLDAARSSREAAEAADAILDALIGAFRDGGTSRQQLALIATATRDLAVGFSGPLMADAQAGVMARANRLQALLMTAAIESQLAEVGASADSQKRVADAAALLQSRIDAAARAGLQSQATIKLAWEDYSMLTNAQLAIVLSLDDKTLTALHGTLTNATAALNDERANLAGQRSISAAASMETNALVHFEDSVMARSALITGTGGSEASASAWLSASLDLCAAATSLPPNGQ